MPQKLIELLVQILTARLTQILSRPLMALATAYGVERVKADDAVSAIVAGVVAVVLFAFDLLVHSKRAENLRRLLGDLHDEAKGPYEPALDLKKLVPLLLIGGLLIGGCSAATPQVQVARQEQAFTLGLEAVDAGIESGRLDKEQYKRLRPLVIAVSAYLDDAKASAADIAALEAKLAASVNTDERARLQQELDVARDTFTRAMRSLNAALKAFNAAQQEAGHATAAVRDAVEPVGTTDAGADAGGVGWAAGFGGGGRRWWVDHAPAVAGA
jgi:hypothetical protein